MVKLRKNKKLKEGSVHTNFILHKPSLNWGENVRRIDSWVMGYWTKEQSIDNPTHPLISTPAPSHLGIPIWELQKPHDFWLIASVISARGLASDNSETHGTRYRLHGWFKNYSYPLPPSMPTIATQSIYFRLFPNWHFSTLFENKAELAMNKLLRLSYPVISGVISCWTICQTNFYETGMRHDVTLSDVIH